MKTLFKKTSTGTIQYWSIWIEEKIPVDNISGYYIVTEYGQNETNNPQITKDLISKGKNIGKKNETSIRDQAIKEMTSRWEKKKKKGYVEKLYDANKGVLDPLILGGVEPMLAHSYDKHGDKIRWPAYAQPKLDGHRCIAMIDNSQCTLWTRTRKLISSVPHINSELVTKFGNGTSILDGELYNHDFKNNFEHISHLVRQETPDPKHKDVEYHIYDMINTETFEERFKYLKDQIVNLKYCKLVFTSRIIKQEDTNSYFNMCIDKGYEGIMLRNSDSLYVNKRSYDLQKVKEFEDAEFKIVGIKEGRGKLVGHIGAFQCIQDNGSKFDVKMAGDTNKLREYFNDHELWQNKFLTVQFQGRSKYGIPRFPIGIRFRDD